MTIGRGTPVRRRYNIPVSAPAASAFRRRVNAAALESDPGKSPGDNQDNVPALLRCIRGNGECERLSGGMRESTRYLVNDFPYDCCPFIEKSN